MKNRILSVLLCAAFLSSLTMPALAADQPEPSTEITGTGLTLLNSISIDTTQQDTFLTAPSGNPPEIPETGFLQALDAPLKTPGENGLMTEVSPREDNAQGLPTLNNCWHSSPEATI